MDPSQTSIENLKSVKPIFFIWSCQKVAKLNRKISKIGIPYIEYPSKLICSRKGNSFKIHIVSNVKIEFVAVDKQSWFSRARTVVIVIRKIYRCSICTSESLNLN